MTKRFKRRLCSVALSLSMLASLTPGTAFADEAPDGELLTELQGYSAEYPLGGG